MKHPESPAGPDATPAAAGQPEPVSPSGGLPVVGGSGAAGRRWKKIALRAVAAALAVVLGLFCFVLWTVWSPSPQDLSLPAGQLSALGEPGRARLAESDATADHAALWSSRRTQIHGSYCGIASIVTAMGALEAGPVDQRSLFNPDVNRVQDRWDAFFGGITLDEMAGMLGARGLSIKIHHLAPDPDQLAMAKAAMVANLKQPGGVVIVNYDRAAVSQAGAGHLSPVSAYHAATDSFLVLDTATYKYPPHWVSAEQLLTAMATRDSASNDWRGFVEVTR